MSDVPFSDSSEFSLGKLWDFENELPEELLTADLPPYPAQSSTQASQSMHNSAAEAQEPVQPMQVPNTQNVAQEGPPSNVNVASSSNGTAAQTTDLDKRKLSHQHQLMFLLHAHKCQRRGNQCALTHCHRMRNVLNHMTSCQAGTSCTVPHCSSSRQIISHWKNCTRSDCPFCLPLKQALDRRQQQAATALQQNQPNQGPAPADMQRSYAALGLPHNAGGSGVLNQVMQRGQNVGVPHVDVQFAQCQQQPQTLNHIPDHQTQPQTQVQLTPIGPSFTAAGQTPQNFLIAGDNNPLSVQNNMSGVTLLQFPPNQIASLVQGLIPQSPSPTKDWHQSVTRDLRNHLVQKIVQAIFPTTDVSVLKDKRMINLVAYAQKLEEEMYKTANSREEYYQLLAEKISEIQKELEAKRQKRKEQNLQQIQQ